MTERQKEAALSRFLENREYYETWGGIDVSLEVNFSDYGLLMRAESPYSNENKYLFQVYVRIGEEDDHWYYDTFDYEFWLDLLEESDTYSIGKIAKMCGDTEEEYIESINPINLFWDMMMYYGVFEITDYGAALKCFTTDSALREIIGIENG